MGDRPDLTTVENEREPFDPTTVPAYPMVRVVIRQTDDGDLEGVVDDKVVATDVELEPVRAAVIAAAAKVAAKLIGATRATRVQGTAPDGSTFSLVVTADSQVYDITDTPAPGSATKPRGRTTAKDKGWSPLFFLVLLVPVLLIGAPLAVLVVARTGGGGAAATPPPPGPTQLPVLAPPPYAAVAAWSVDLGPATFTAAAAVAADSSRVYAVSNNGHDVTAYDATTGVRAWSFTDLDGGVSAGPALETVDGTQVVAAASSSQLVLLDPATGSKEGEWDLPSSGSGVQLTATGPVVLQDASHVKIVEAGHLVTRVLPATGTPVAPAGAGALVAVDSAGRAWSVVSDSLAGAPHRLQGVAGAAYDSVAGWSGDRLVLVYRSTSATAQDGVRLAAYDPATWRQEWVSGWLPADYSGNQAAPLVLASDGSWGIYATRTVTMSNGRTHVLPSDWQTTGIGDRWAFGTSNDRPLVASAAGVTKASKNGPVAPSTGTVVAPQASAGDAAFLVASNGGTDQYLYALRIGTSVAPRISENGDHG